MDTTVRNQNIPDWRLRKGLATLGVVASSLLFIMVGQENYNTHLSEQKVEQYHAKLNDQAQEFVAWQKQKAEEKVATTGLLKMAQATSSSVAVIASYDFDIIETAQVNAAEQKCLAEAIYFEAGFEQPIGKMAVADVILNRVESPIYPDTICGVVYQGSHRQTGCQFSFTCDGSLNRKRYAKAYNSADKMAQAILAGIHLPVSNNATHYHADYVNPYWAPKLTPTAQIGAHKFYKTPKKDTTTITAAAQ